MNHKNRIIFAETFKENLPVKIKKTLRKGEKLKILMTSLSFDDTLPKSNIMLEIASKLKKENHDVTICSNINGKIGSIAKNNGINLAPIQQPPGFALGDGKWVLKTKDGDVPSQPNMLYKVKDYNFDIIHVYDDGIIEHMNKLYNGISIVNTKFTNGLFTSVQENPLSSVIELSGDIDAIKKLDINNIVNQYIETL